MIKAMDWKMKWKIKTVIVVVEINSTSKVDMETFSELNVE